MKLIDNIEMSHVQEIVISHKVFYVKDEDCDYVRDDKRSEESSIKNNAMPKGMGAKDMSDYVREYIGRKKWKIVLSSGTINIFKRGSGRKIVETASKNTSNKSKVVVKKSKTNVA
jgi:hypothetical protein